MLFILVIIRIIIHNHKIFIMNSPRVLTLIGSITCCLFYILVLNFVCRLFYCVKRGPKHLKCVTLLNMLRYTSINCTSLHSLSIWILTIYSICSLLIHNPTFFTISKYFLRICLTFLFKLCHQKYSRSLILEFPNIVSSLTFICKYVIEKVHSLS